MKQVDIDWFRDHVDDPLFDVGPDAEDARVVDVKLPRRRGRPRRDAAPVVVEQGRLGDGGHAPSTQTEDRDLAPLQPGADTDAHDDAATGTEPVLSGAVKDSVGRTFEQHRDPDNWDED